MNKVKFQRGIALVIVLVFLVLLSVFIVGFFSNSQDELTAAQSFTGEVSAHQLAESAVSVVMGQIREATGRTNGAWGSQPGMIRVYRSGDIASDSADAFFKLYSSDDMILSGAEISKWNPTTEVPEGENGWNHQPAAWTDINEKVRVVSKSENGKVEQASRYPILDPTLEGKVEGLEFIPNAKADGASAENPARMPVRWLYVLKDGSLTAPSTVSADGLEAKWTTANRAPTKTNPIVGRVAFWTDDETSKVNVNTAGGYSLKEVKDGLKDRAGNYYVEDNYPGSFWDAPRAYTKFDRGVANQTDGEMDQPSLALSQPVRGEFQRYPGHPSTTSLGILFRDRKKNATLSMQESEYLLTSGQLALLSPRLQYSIETAKKSERGSNYGIDRLLASYDTPPGLRVKRLYANPDELFFAQPDPSSTNLTTRAESDRELKTTKDVLTPDLLEKMRFFLTAYSRAPEINLWGKPRMSLWPVREVKVYPKDETEYWNASDRLIAFCSTIGPNANDANGEANVKRFILQRSDWSSPTADSSISRNAKLYNYLRGLTDTPIPGFGGDTFRQKYSNGNGHQINDRDQILTEMFDYIRVVNLRDSTRDKLIVKNLKTVTNPDGRDPTVNEFRQMESYRYAPRGLVVPLRFTADGKTTSGFGRFPTVSEVALVLYHAGYKGSDNKRYFLKNEMPKGMKPTANLVRAFIALQTFNPMQGFAPITTPSGNSIPANQRPIVIEIDNLDQFSIDGKNLGFPGKNDPFARTSFNYSSVDFWNGRNLGGSEGFFHTLCKKSASMTIGVNGNLAGENPYLAGGAVNPEFYGLQSIVGRGAIGSSLHPGVEIPFDRKTLELTGADLVMRIKFDTNALPISTLNLTFPSATVPVPNGGQDREVSDADFYSEMRDQQAFWQLDPGGFVPSDAGRNPLWAANKEIPDPLGIGENGKPLFTYPAFVKSFAGRIVWINVPKNNPTSHNAESGDYTASTTFPVVRNNKWRQILQPGDVIRSMTLGKSDFRLACIQNQQPGDASLFEPHPDYQAQSMNNNPVNYRACSLRCGSGTLYFDGVMPNGPQEATAFGNITTLQSGRLYYPTSAAALALSTSSANASRYNDTVALRRDGKPGDFDTGLGNLADGPFCNKADEGNLTFKTEVKDSAGKSYSPRRWTYTYPYFDWTYGETFDTFFTPNRQVPSAVLFGSLLAGRGLKWETLCFSPNPAGDSHPGRSGSGPKDYLWLDLFTMPVVEPYAISEPFSTAGKINMNYQIVPFSNIKRSSGLRAALQPVRVTAYAALDSNLYNTSIPPQMVLKVGKSGALITNLSARNDYRYLVDRDETLKAFDYYFTQYGTGNGGFFKSAAQICDFYLYPKQAGSPVVKWNTGETAIKNWWRQNSLTGDNLRERPYADLYPRLTTKSNTYCVHVRAQALRQSAASDSASAATHYLTWSEKRDRVIGEYRGSSIIERYIDPQDERFRAAANPDSPQDTGTVESIDVDKKSLDTAYRFRVLNTKRFDP